MGRPTDYDPDYCGVAEDFLADGYSMTALAGHIGVARSTVFKWVNEHPEFSDAVKRGSAKATLWWEKANRQLALTGEGNATSIIFGLKNRASEDWRDVKSTEISGPDGGAINVKAEKAEWSIIDTATPSGT